MQRLGFSLLELLIVVLLIGLLSTLAFSSYQQSVLRSYRAEAVTTLLTLANRQEQQLLDFGEYSADVAKLGLTEGKTLSGRYQLHISLAAGATEYSMILTAQGAQQQDHECQHFSLNHLGQRNLGLTEPLHCWR